MAIDGGYADKYWLGVAGDDVVEIIEEECVEAHKKAMNEAYATVD